MRNERMKAIDAAVREAHYYLSDDDECYFFMEYVKGAGYGPPGNNFINNLKKKPNTRTTPQWNYKMRAIEDAAVALRRELPANWLANSTFIPIPPSKTKLHVEYDDRMTQVLTRLGQHVDVRELVYQRRSVEETHYRDDRYSVEQLVANYAIDEDKVQPPPTHIVIVDDVVTAGKHFRAMRRVLEERFPGVPVSGVFLARRVFPPQ